MADIWHPSQGQSCLLFVTVRLTAKSTSYSALKAESETPRYAKMLAKLLDIRYSYRKPPYSPATIGTNLTGSTSLSIILPLSFLTIFSDCTEWTSPTGTIIWPPSLS